MLVLAVRNEQRFEIEVPDDLTIRYPVNGPIVISQGFGIRSITGNIHKGVDIVVGQVPCLNVANGDVLSTYPYGYDAPGLVSDGSPGGYGNTVLVHHRTPSGWHYWSYHCHLLPGSIRVEEGDVVTLGQQIGITDTTGISTGNHEHFELRSDTLYPTRFDPMPFFNRDVIKPPEDIFDMLDAAGKEAAEAIFNDPKKVKYLQYAIELCQALEDAKPGATPLVVGSSLVTLGPDGRKATELDGRALGEIHKAKKIDPVTHQQVWDELVLDSLVLQRVREQRQWLAANPVGVGTEPPSPGTPPTP